MYIYIYMCVCVCVCVCVEMIDCSESVNMIEIYGKWDKSNTSTQIQTCDNSFDFISPNFFKDHFLSFYISKHVRRNDKMVGVK